MAYLYIYFAIFVTILISLTVYLWRHFTYWSRNGVRGPNFIDFDEFLTEKHIYAINSAKKYGRIYGGYTLFGKTLVVSDPDLIYDIMVKDFYLFSDRQDIYVGTNQMKSALFFLPGNNQWKRIRSIISPSFTSGKLRLMMSHMHDISDYLIKNIEKIPNKEEAIDFRKYLVAFVMDVISACAYGVNIDSINDANHPIVVNAKRILNIDYNISVILSYIAPKIAELLKLEPMDIKGVQFFADLTNKIVNERKKLVTNKANKMVDFVQLMIDAEQHDDNETINMIINSKTHSDKTNKNNNHRTLSPEEITAQGIAFILAGHDTTGAALTHCFHLLSQHQDCQQKLFEELLTAPDFDYNTLNKLKYLNGIIDETLRLYPSFMHFNRKCKNDYKLGNTGITIPANTEVTFLPYALHRDPNYFEDPDQFKPERFINPTHNPRAYIPFGGGQRNCIGMRFALNEMRVCIAKLVKNFKFEPKPDFKLQYYNGNVLFSPKELMLYIKSRNINE